MMQNSPLLVTQANTAKNAPPSSMPQQSSEGAESFKQVLSKQVEQEDAPAEKTVDQLADLSDDIEAKEEQTPVSLIAAESEAREKKPVDAAMLALAETAKAVHDVTDGEVDLDLTQEAGKDKLLVANFTPIIQPNTTKATGVPMLNPAVEKGLALATKSSASVSSGDLVSDAATVEVDIKEDVPSTKGNLKADVLVDNDKSVNHKLANYLAADKNPRITQEAPISQTVSSVTDMAGLSATPLQTALKAASAPLTSVEQAGFSNVMNTAPGKAGWNEAIGQKVVWMVGAAEQSATLTLNPKDLGPLQVIIHVNNEKADATFISENPEVRKALEEGMSSLRQSMGQTGVELGQANVNTSKQHQEFQQASKEYFARQANGNEVSEDVDLAANAMPTTRVSNGLVDTFV